MLRALVERDGVPLDALVAAGLAIDLYTEENLLDAAALLAAAYAEDPRRADGGWFAPFAACCEYARLLRSDGEGLAHGLSAALERLSGAREAGEGAAGGSPGAGSLARVLELVAVAHLPGEERARVLAGRGDPLAGSQADPLRGAARVAIFAGGADSMSQATVEQLSRLLGGDCGPEAAKGALYRYDGVVLSGGSSSGVCRAVAEAARRNGVSAVGYAPRGSGDALLYPQLRETDAGDFSVREPLAMWTDMLAAGISPDRVCLIACPGGDISCAEILLARALGARVGWIDPCAEAPLPLEDDLPGGDEQIVKLPADAMCLRAMIARSTLAIAGLREALAKFAHDSYRASQLKNKPPGDAALAPWERLLPAFRESNLSQVDDIPNKLAIVGLRLAEHGAPLELADEQVLLLAMMEHGRYVVERLGAGWQSGDREASRRSSPYLQPWEDLDEQAKSWDRNAVLAIAPALSRFGYGVAPLEPAERGRPGGEAASV